MKQKYKIIASTFLFLGFFSVAFADVFVSEDTENWLAYTDCSAAEANHVTVTPATIPTFWTGNTIYDLEAGTYNLASTINITETCTALVGADGVIINGNGTTVINITNKYNIINNLKIFAIAADGIYFSATNSNAVVDTTVYGANRGIYLTTTTNTTIRNIKIYGNTAGIYLNTSANDNILNNIISFNNSQYGIYINGGSRNTVNNSLFFNNGMHGVFVQVGTKNILNNSIFYNNPSNGLRVIGGNYINNVKTFNNNPTPSLANVIPASSTGYGITYSDVTLPVGLKFGLNTDAILGNIGWSNGSVNTGLVTTSSQILNPFDGTNYLIDTTTATGTRKGVKTFGTNLDIASSQFGSNLPNQVQPVKWNAGGTALENSSVSFSPSKKIGQAISVGGGGGNSNSTSGPVCGNKLLENSEQCDDGNKRNGDGCTKSCQTEAPGICGNNLLEYMEQCDDNNLVNGDGCSASCQIESSAEMYIKKYGDLKKNSNDYLFGIDPTLLSGGFIASGASGNTVISPAQIILAGVEQGEKDTTSLECQYNDASYHSINFQDMANQYAKEIETLVNYCIVQGRVGIDGNRLFDSNQPATYAEFIKVLVKTHFLGRQIDFGTTQINIHQVYKNIDNKARYAPYISKAYVYDLLIPLATLSPDKPIYKVDAVKLLINSLKLAGKNPKNIESITDTFTRTDITPLTRGEMTALITHGYELDYTASQRLRSNNKILIKLISKTLEKYSPQKQLEVLQNSIKVIGGLNEILLKKQSIYKQELLMDLQNVIDISQKILNK